MAFDIHSNFAYGTVVTAPSPATTGTTVVIGTENYADFPDPGTSTPYQFTVWPSGTFPLSSNAEVGSVVGKVTNGTLYLSRSAQGTRTVVVGDQFMMPITKKVLVDVERLSNQYAPEGMVVNGQITTSVSSNNLTVSLIGLDGGTFSATNPGYVRIGTVVRAITTGLTFTLAAGTNWFESGNAHLAAQDVDYFAYLGYRASDTSVFLGMSKYPMGLTYGQFNGTNNVDSYLAYSGAAPAATDRLVNIGRFNATLGTSATYNWSIGTSVIINKPTYQTRLLTYAPTFAGFSTNPSGAFNFQMINSEALINHYLAAYGTSSATNYTYTVPYQGEPNNGQLVVVTGQYRNGGSDTFDPVQVNVPGGGTHALLRNGGETNWTNTGAKGCYVHYKYTTLI